MCSYFEDQDMGSGSWVWSRLLVLLFVFVIFFKEGKLVFRTERAELS